MRLENYLFKPKYWAHDIYQSYITFAVISAQEYLFHGTEVYYFVTLLILFYLIPYIENFICNKYHQAYYIMTMIKERDKFYVIHIKYFHT